jgi:hypothetical protein
VVKREVEKAVAEVREDMEKVWKEVQEQKKTETPTPVSAAARSWGTVLAGEAEPPKKLIPGKLAREILVRRSTEPALAQACVGSDIPPGNRPGGEPGLRENGSYRGTKIAKW